MAKRNILIKKKNGTAWDELYPITTANNVKMSNGKDVEKQFSENEAGLKSKQDKKIKDDNTSKKYELGIKNGLLYYREVL